MLSPLQRAAGVQRHESGLSEFGQSRRCRQSGKTRKVPSHLFDRVPPLTNIKDRESSRRRDSFSLRIKISTQFTCLVKRAICMRGNILRRTFSRQRRKNLKLVESQTYRVYFPCRVTILIKKNFNEIFFYQLSVFRQAENIWI